MGMDLVDFRDLRSSHIYYLWGDDRMALTAICQSCERETPIRMLGMTKGFCRKCFCDLKKQEASSLQRNFKSMTLDEQCHVVESVSQYELFGLIGLDIESIMDLCTEGDLP